MEKQKGYISHVVGVGDSLQRLSVLYGVENWQEIAVLNDLVYPFLDDRIASKEFIDNPHIAKVGDKILIPADYSRPMKAKIVKTELEEQAYGKDLDLFSPDTIVNLEEKRELTGKDGDLQVAHGIRNLRQRLLLRLSIPMGSYILHPDYGSQLAQMVGLKSTEQNRIKMGLEVKRCILTDPLIQDVSRVSVSSNGGSVTIDCDIIPVPPHETFAFQEVIDF